MSNLIEIQSQIEKLQKQASDIRAKEFHKTVTDILAQMQAFGITLKDLQGAQRQVVAKSGSGRGRAKVVDKKPAAKRRNAKTGKAVAAKYRGPKGETWSGRGLMPRWLVALVAQGRKKEEFSVGA